MGICMVAQTLSDEKITKILENPPLVWRIVSPDDTDFYLQEVGESGPLGLFSKLLGKKRKLPPEIPDFTFEGNESHEVDLDKSWDGINYCIKKLIPPNECPNLFEDGRPVGKVDVGYGPAMCFSSEEVSRIAMAYCGISEEDLNGQFTPTEMTGVYLDGLWQEGGDDALEYLTENFTDLKAFLSLAKKHDLGMLVYYT